MENTGFINKLEDESYLRSKKYRRELRNVFTSGEERSLCECLAYEEGFRFALRKVKEYLGK